MAWVLARKANETGVNDFVFVVADLGRVEVFETVAIGNATEGWKKKIWTLCAIGTNGVFWDLVRIVFHHYACVKCKAISKMDQGAPCHDVLQTKGALWVNR